MRTPKETLLCFMYTCTHVPGLSIFNEFLIIALLTVLFSNGPTPKKSSNIVIALLSVLHHSFHHLQYMRCGRGLEIVLVDLMVKHQQAHSFSYISETLTVANSPNPDLLFPSAEKNENSV